MKKLFFFTVFLMFFVSIAYCGSIEDIKNKLNKNTAKKEGKNFSAGKRFKIMKAKIYQKTRYYYKQDGSTVHAVTVTFRIKKMMQGETFISPEVFKTYIYDRKKKLVTVLTRYLMAKEFGGSRESGQFRVNKSYNVFFDMDYETRKKAKYFVVVLGIPGEEVVVKASRGSVFDYDFDEKSYIHQ